MNVMMNVIMRKRIRQGLPVRKIPRSPYLASIKKYRASPAVPTPPNRVTPT